MLPAHSTVNFTAVIPQVGIVPLSTALLQKSIVICPHFVALETSIVSLQKPTTDHYLVSDEFILHNISD